MVGRVAKQWLRSLSLLAVIGVWTSACEPSGPPAGAVSGDTVVLAPVPTSSDAVLLASAKVGLPPPGIGPGDLPDGDSVGAKHLQAYCTSCHALPSPWAHSATDWPLVLRRMWLRMERVDSSFHVPVPNAGERIAMQEYVVDHALKVTLGGLPEGRDREFFLTTCSQCHEVPDPTQHSAQDWRAVVRRMTDHMIPMLGKTLTPDDLTRIARYLAIASSPTDQ